VPIADFDVRGELTRLLDDNWQPVIEKDVDGEHALPVEIDRENASQLGRYSATRRVARTVFLGSAPIEGATNRGIDDRHLRLGVVQPGESIATFGDALRRLENRATYLYADTGRHWYARTPTVNRTAQDRAAQLRRDEVLEEIRRRLRKAATGRAQFARVHAAPRTSTDVPDDDEVRLVILDPDHVHNGRGAEDSAARAAAQEILDTRGSSPRLHRNMLAFLAANASQLEALEQGVREYLAWKSIEADHESLNLDSHQRNQAHTKHNQADNAVEQRLPEAYNVLLVPTQPDPTGPVEWQESRLLSQGTLAERAARKLINDGAMIVDTYGYALLRADLDRIPLWRGDDISVRELWELHAKYLYLPRLRDSRVLLETIRAGTNQMLWHAESWAYAQRKDENGRYHGLTWRQDTSIAMDGNSLVVKPA
ncbi:MAG TPA: hypothetical protein PKA95_17715, partial [Thermomicrobiales bacterium]|nr:hypothetical protein [Thermomicrobiales bacterium]